MQQVFSGLAALHLWQVPIRKQHLGFLTLPLVVAASERVPAGWGRVMDGAPEHMFAMSVALHTFLHFPFLHPALSFSHHVDYNTQNPPASMANSHKI